MDQQVPQVEIAKEMEEISEDDWNQMFKKGKFKKQDMDMLVMDFLVYSKFTDAVKAFHTESGCPMGIKDVSVLETMKKVRNLIYDLQFDEAISLLTEKLGLSFLAKIPRVHYLLEQQKLIELCRAGDFKAALDFSRQFAMWKNLKVEGDDFEKECRTALLLIKHRDDKNSPAYNLLHTWWRSFVVVTTIHEMFRFHGREPGGNLIRRALKMLRLEQYKLNKVVKFPNFRIDSGYPEPLPHPDGPFRDLFHRLDDDYTDTYTP